MSKRLEDLQPDVMFKAKAAIAILEQYGIPYMVTSTLRTEAEQKALYAQGREPLEKVNALRVAAGMRPIVPYPGVDHKMHSDNEYPVTNADGVKNKSNHQGGRAIDVVPTENGNPVWPPLSDPRWAKIADVFRGQGFKWGGDWLKFPDPPHYELPAIEGAN